MNNPRDLSAVSSAKPETWTKQGFEVRKAVISNSSVVEKSGLIVRSSWVTKTENAERKLGGGEARTPQFFLSIWQVQ